VRLLSLQTRRPLERDDVLILDTYEVPLSAHVLTNIEGIHVLTAWRRYNAGAVIEQRIAELGQLSVGQTAVDDLDGNALLWSLGMLAYQLLHTLRRTALSGSWRSAQPKRLRLWLLRLPAKLTRHARKTPVRPMCSCSKPNPHGPVCSSLSDASTVCRLPSSPDRTPSRRRPKAEPGRPLRASARHDTISTTQRGAQNWVSPGPRPTTSAPTWSYRPNRTPGQAAMQDPGSIHVSRSWGNHPAWIAEFLESPALDGKRRRPPHRDPGTTGAPSPRTQAQFPITFLCFRRGAQYAPCFSGASEANGTGNTLVIGRCSAGV